LALLAHMGGPFLPIVQQAAKALWANHLESGAVAADPD
jgi:hypothetical protein